MPVFGLASAFIVATLADLGGNDKTRWFTRRAFALYLLHFGGVGASDVVHWTGVLMGMLPI